MSQDRHLHALAALERLIASPPSTKAATLEILRRQLNELRSGLRHIGVHIDTRVIRRADKSEIIEMYRKGMPVREIAKHLDLTHQRIYQILKEK